jgi:hypothetical protein
MPTTHQTGKTKKPSRSKPRRTAKKGLLSSMIVETKDTPHDHNHHPVHCPTCHGERIIDKDKHRLVGSSKKGRPGPEC